MACNLISHPIAWVLYGLNPTWIFFGAIEILVVIFEAVLLRTVTGLSIVHAFWISVIANGATALIGLWFFNWI